MNKLSKQFDLLKVLSNKSIKPNIRRAIIVQSDRELINVISEIVLNVLLGNVVLNIAQKRYLKRFSKTLHELVQKKKDFQFRKRIIESGVQTFVPVVLQPITANFQSLVESPKRNLSSIE